ncbi:hypothetical protein [Vibrio maritimus]
MLFVGISLQDHQLIFSDVNGHTVLPRTSLSNTYNHREHCRC